MPNITVLCGEEDFLLDEELTQLKKRAADSTVERISGDKKNTDNVVNSLTALPMFFSKKLLIIDDLACEEGQDQKIIDAISNISEGVSVIFVFYGTFDKRRKISKKLEAVATVREFKRFTEWETDKVLAWLVTRIKLYGKKISGVAADLLVEAVGGNLRLLDKELEKICTYIGDRPQIEEADIRTMASSGELNSFELSNAVRDKDTTRAVKLLERLLMDNEDPFSMVGMLARLYRSMLQVKVLAAKGRDQYGIASELKAKPFFVKKCLEGSRSFSIEELSGNIKKLHEADLKMKSGYLPRLILETLVPELCNAK